MLSDCASVSFEDFSTSVNVAHIFLVRLLSAAGTIAFVDVVIETKFIFPRFYAYFCHWLMAWTRFVELLTQIQQGIHRGQVAIGTKIGGSPAFAVSCLEDAGEVFLGNGDGGVGLIVFE